MCCEGNRSFSRGIPPPRLPNRGIYTPLLHTNSLCTVCIALVFSVLRKFGVVWMCLRFNQV